jgi:hypothetical protein
LRSRHAHRPGRTAVRGCLLVDTRKPGRPTCGWRTTGRSVGQERLAKAGRSAARPGSPGVDRVGRGWGPASSRERTWPLSLRGCRRAAGPCRSPSRWDGKMGVKCPNKGAKWRLLREHATLLFIAQLLYCHAVASIVVEKSAARQITTTIYSLRTCVENMVSQIFKKAEKRSIP